MVKSIDYYCPFYKILSFCFRIPHDFGMKRPPLISDMGTVKTKISLLEVLGDIQVLKSRMNMSKKKGREQNEITTETITGI